MLLSRGSKSSERTPGPTVHVSDAGRDQARLLEPPTAPGFAARPAERGQGVGRPLHGLGQGRDLHPHRLLVRAADDLQPPHGEARAVSGISARHRCGASPSSCAAVPAGVVALVQRRGVHVQPHLPQVQGGGVRRHRVPQLLPVGRTLQAAPRSRRALLAASRHKQRAAQRPQPLLDQHHLGVAEKPRDDEDADDGQRP